MKATNWINDNDFSEGKLLFDDLPVVLDRKYQPGFEDKLKESSYSDFVVKNNYKSIGSRYQFLYDVLVDIADVFGCDFNLVFYDLTTLYFESFKTDELRRIGFW